MKIRMMVTALAVGVLALGMSLSADAAPWRGYHLGPRVAVRVFAPMPRFVVPQVTVVAGGGGYYGEHYRPHREVRYERDNCNNGYNNNGYYNNGYNSYNNGYNNNCNNNNNNGYYNNGYNGYNYNQRACH